MANETTNSNDIVVSSSIPENTQSNTPDTTTMVHKAIVPPMQKKQNIPQQKPVMKTSMNQTNVDKLKNLILKFETNYKEKKETITDWINLCNYLNRTNDPKVFQEFYVWFAKHLKDYTSAEIALAGVHNIQNANTKIRVGSTHQCFEELARVLASKTAHYRFTIKSMQAMAISETLAKWLLGKSAR